MKYIICSMQHSCALINVCHNAAAIQFIQYSQRKRTYLYINVASSTYNKRQATAALRILICRSSHPFNLAANQATPRRVFVHSYIDHWLTDTHTPQCSQSAKIIIALLLLLLQLCIEKYVNTA